VSKRDWRERWDPKTAWKGTEDFLAYRDELVARTLQVVADWRPQKSRVSKMNKNLAFLCGRLELLIDESEALGSLPAPSGGNLEARAHDLADLLSVLPQTNCWEVHGDRFAVRGETPPDICADCPLAGPVKGLSGSHLYYGCDALTFMGEKLVEWRAGYPANPWPEPGVWYSAFETNRHRH
jgi:hypothetical protein